MPGAISFSMKTHLHTSYLNQMAVQREAKTLFAFLYDVFMDIAHNNINI